MRINPINISQNHQLRNANFQQDVEDVENSGKKSYELSGYKAGRAMFAQNNVSFKNLAMPIEVTDRYNKKVEGKDHLDLPNIHVYEYPDTNLQVIVNADSNIKSFQDNKLEFPRYSIIIENNDYEKHNLLKGKLLYFLLNKDNIDVVSSSFCLGIYNSEETDLLNDIKRINQEVFNKKINNKDLEDAKNKLKLFLKSSEYIEQNKYVKELYSNNDLKTEEELTTEIEDITTKDMQEYYKEYLRNSSVRVFLTTSKEYFEQNKNILLKQINPETNLKFLNVNIAIANTPEFIDTTAIKDKTILKIPTKAANTKDSIIENIAINILNSDTNFSKNYSLSSNSFSIPTELKNNSPIKYHCNFCTINLKNKIKDFIDFSNDLNEICNKNLASEIEQQKKEIKAKLKQTFAGERLDLIKHLELISYSDAIFNLYETIDSIREDEIKQYYNNLVSLQNKNE